MALKESLVRHGRDNDEAIRFLETLYSRWFRSTARLYRLLGRLPGFFGLFRPLLRRAMDKTYPQAGWRRTWLTDSSHEMSFQMESCYYREVLQHHGHQDLLGLFCGIDDLLYTTLSDRVRWCRTTTLARGGGYCDFRFCRIARPVAPGHAASLGLSLWMYLGGPGVWGAWMVWRLKILTLGDFMSCLWPTGLMLLGGFWVAAWANLRGRGSARFHALWLTVFATLGTGAFLLIPTGLGLPGPRGQQVLVGALAGTSLVGLFYPVFSLRLFSKRPSYSTNGPFLRRFHLWAYVGALACYLVVAWCSKLLVPLDGGTVVAALLPLAMSAFLLGRSYEKP